MSLNSKIGSKSTDNVSLYLRKYKRFVVKLSKQLSLQECEELFYLYKGEAMLSETLRPNLTTAEGSPLRLLEALEKAREFCCYQPQKLKEIFSAIDRENLVTEVETFVANNEEAIRLTRTRENDYAQVHSNPNHTLLRNVYTQATEADGPYRLRAASDTGSIADGAYVRFQRPTSAEAVAQRELPSVPQVKQENKPLKRSNGIRKKKQRPASVASVSESNPYSYIDSRTLRLDLSWLRANEEDACQSPASASSSSACSLSPPLLHGSRGLGVFSSSSSEDRQGSSPDMDGLSDSSDDHIYEYLPDTYPLQLVASEPRPLVEEKIRLLVRPIQKMIQRKEHRTISTDKILASHHSFSNVSFQLRILTGCQFYPTQTESDLTESNSFVSAELYLLSDSKFPDSLLLQAKLQVCLPKRSLRKQIGRKEGQYSSSKSIKPKCICEQTVPLDLPVTASESSKKSSKPLCVASFTVMSHKNFMNEKVVGDHHLNIHLFIREY